ncbi:MAG: hypothetical protein ACREHV_09195 [Rhizomicrobium sp.]
MPARSFRRYISKNHIARRIGTRWVFYKRGRRRMLVFSNGQRHWPTLNLRETRKNSLHLNAVRRLIYTHDREPLEQFTGQSIKDVHGNEFPFETRPNVLYRLNLVPEPFHEIYQILT